MNSPFIHKKTKKNNCANFDNEGVRDYKRNCDDENGAIIHLLNKTC